MRQPLRRSRLARLLAHAGVVLGAGWLAACSSVSPGTTAQNPHGAQLRHGEPVLVTESDAVRQLNAASQAQGDDSEVIVSNDLWDRIRAGFAMPELDSPLVARHEQYYLSRPDYLQRMFGRGSFYLHHIVEEVERRGMPTELALLPFVESAMNPSALSSAKAAGLWQFIPATGKRYDLNQNWWVDNRRDVVQSTRAALDYLQSIYQMNGDDWFLALASYNWGEGAVRRAVRANQAAGRPADYANLRMPNETRNYVPKLLALKHIVLNARQLGLQLPDLPDQPYFVTVEKTRPIDLKLAAQFAGMTEAEFLALNPAHNRPVISASRNNTLKIPVDRIDRFKADMAEHAAQKRPFVSWQPHTLQPGESLAEIASRGGLTVPALLRANGISAGTHLLAGTRLLVPTHRVSDENLVEQFDGPRLSAGSPRASWRDRRLHRPPLWPHAGRTARHEPACLPPQAGHDADGAPQPETDRAGGRRRFPQGDQPPGCRASHSHRQGSHGLVGQPYRHPAGALQPGPCPDRQQQRGRQPQHGLAPRQPRHPALRPKRHPPHPAPEQQDHRGPG